MSMYIFIVGYAAARVACKKERGREIFHSGERERVSVRRSISAPLVQQTHHYRGCNG